MINDISYGWVLWLGFSVFLLLALSIDTLVLNKKHGGPHQSLRAALSWTLVWISLALIFNGLLWFYLYVTVNAVTATKVSLLFFTGYLIEKSLSMDNLFVFYLIFQQFSIPLAEQRRVLAYGIWSAIILRLLLILAGSWLIQQFHWVLYVMGLFLLLTGIKMCFNANSDLDLTSSKIFTFLQRFLRLTSERRPHAFFIHKRGLLYATPLFMALVFIEIMDVVFAFDSIPAIFAITTDPFIIWTSNIFAILGLRAMYFLLVGLVKQFDLLKYAIALILVFVGCKMLMAPWATLSVELSLAIIASILLSFSAASWLKGR